MTFPKDDVSIGRYSICIILYGVELFGVKADHDKDDTNKVADDYSTNEDAVTNDVTDDVSDEVPFGVSSREFEADAVDDTIANEDDNDDADDDEGEYFMMDEYTDELITHPVDINNDFYLTPTADEPDGIDVNDDSTIKATT